MWQSSLNVLLIKPEVTLELTRIHWSSCNITLQAETVLYWKSAKERQRERHAGASRVLSFSDRKMQRTETRGESERSSERKAGNRIERCQNKVRTNKNKVRRREQTDQRWNKGCTVFHNQFVSSFHFHHPFSSVSLLFLIFKLGSLFSFVWNQYMLFSHMNTVQKNNADISSILSFW